MKYFVTLEGAEHLVEVEDEGPDALRAVVDREDVVSHDTLQ